MKSLIAFLCVILFSFAAVGQEIKPAVPAIPPVAADVKLKTPTSEVEDAILFLQDDKNGYSSVDVDNIRFFTTYALPQDLRDKAILSLSFVLHSLMGISDKEETQAGGYHPLAIVSGKDKKIEYLRRVPSSTTLFWIDLRDFGFTSKAWEIVSSYDGYFVEPIVEHRTNGLLRLLAGNAVVRADWFIVHASDTQQQEDKKLKPSIYETLVYANTKVPTTIDEFRKTFTLDLNGKGVKGGNQGAAVVTDSDVVARHNRILFQYRTELGWYYQSYDVQNMVGLRDYIESFPRWKGKPPTTFDGGEAFATNNVYMQIYALYNGQEKLVNAGDTVLVRHMNDVLGDVRVRVPHSCFDCHAAGPIPSENTIEEYLRESMRLYVPDRTDKERIKRTYLSGRFEDSIKENQDVFAKSLLKINGLSPEENAKNYLEIVTWYNKDLDVKQVAYECGVTQQIFVDKMKVGLNNNGRVPGRIALMLKNNKNVPRQTWESQGADGIPGVFQQSMIIIHGLTKITEEVIYKVTVIQKAGLYRGTEIIEYADVGEILTITGNPIENKDGSSWIQVKSKTGNTAYILNKNVKEIK